MCCELNLAESWELLCCPCRGPGPAPGSAAGTRCVLGTSGSRRSSHGPFTPHPHLPHLWHRVVASPTFLATSGNPCVCLASGHRAPGPGPASCHLYEENGEEAGGGSRGVCSVLFIYIFYPPRLPTRGAGSRQVRPNHVGSSRGTERSTLRG